MVEIRDGIQVFFTRKPPLVTTPQRDIKDPIVKNQVMEKLQKVIRHGYLVEGLVLSVTSFFPVPKGDTDIRMVYDATCNGLNDSIWVPSFRLPTLNNHLRAVDSGTFMSDVDVGEIFLNFILHDSLQQYCGVDVKLYCNTVQNGMVRWARSAMGMTSSPYHCVRGLAIASEIIKGNRKSENNVFRWDRVRLNLPGQNNYDPTIAWVSLVRKDGTLAAELFKFVDDLRPTGPGKKDAWDAARRTASILNWLGLQDAPRKRRGSSQTPGAWAGGLIKIIEKREAVHVSEDKWKKNIRLLNEAALMVKRSPESVNRLRLEEIRGFMVYVMQTYPALQPYLMGFHLSIDSWRPGRRDDGWRESSQVIQKLKDDGDWTYHGPEDRGPKLVTPAPRLARDIEALQSMCQSTAPPIRYPRPSKQCKVFYGFGDASGSAFGSSILMMGDLVYEYGQ